VGSRRPLEVALGSRRPAVAPVAHNRRSPPGLLSDGQGPVLGTREVQMERSLELDIPDLARKALPEARLDIQPERAAPVSRKTRPRTDDCRQEPRRVHLRRAHRTSPLAERRSRDRSELLYGMAHHTRDSDPPSASPCWDLCLPPLRRSAPYTKSF
jgi:hypothetical protein